MSDFFLDPWHIRPGLNQIQRHDEIRQLGSKVMDLLVCLAEQPNEPVTKEQLIDRVWQGEFTTEESLTTAVYELRKALGDDARCPKYVATVRGRGYRLLGSVEYDSPKSAPVQPSSETRNPSPIEPKADARPPQTSRLLWIAAITAVVALSAFLQLRRQAQQPADMLETWTGLDSAALAGPPTVTDSETASKPSLLEQQTNPYASGPRAVCSVVVVPIESLTADSKSTVFAQGLSEQLAHDLAQSGTLAVVPGYSSVMSGRLSSDLNTDAVVEGSVQASGDRLWIRMQMVDTLAARLLWGGTYAHELENSLDLQHELSKEITRQILEQIEPVADCASSGFESRP